MPNREKCILGVDIGGTKVAAGLVNPAGEIFFKTRAPMLASGDSAAGLAAVCAAIDSVFVAEPGMRESVTAIGICSPGPLDPVSGVVINPPNLTCWRNFPLAAEIQRKYGLPARVDNDANAAALAEAIWGAGMRYESVFYATLGTGLGTGIVFNRRIYHGRTGAAAEGGHVSIDYRGPRCACGKRGCIEAYVAGPAIAQRARARLAEHGVTSSIPGMVGGDLERVTAENIGEAYFAGDKVAAGVMRETAELMAAWLGNVIDLLEPDVMIIGGGVGELISSFFDYIRSRLPQFSINSRCQEIPLVKARYGADAGIAGAAALCSTP